jgi:glutathione S-transferase
VHALTLFLDAFFTSPFDFRCWVALKEKGLEFGASRVMMSEGSGLTAAYKEQSLTGRVPGLLHGDFWLAESMAIVEYLEETFTPPEYPRLWPEDARRRARARQVSFFMGGDLPRLIAERPAWTMLYPDARPPLSPAARVEADELLALTERLLSERALEPWSIACADLTFGLLRLSRSGEPLPPAVAAFVEANAARPSLASYLTHDRPPHPPTTGRRAST